MLDRVARRDLAPRPPVYAVMPMLCNAERCHGAAFPDRAHPAHAAIAAAEVLVYLHHGGGLPRRMMSDLAFKQGDNVCVHRAVLHGPPGALLL